MPKDPTPKPKIDQATDDSHLSNEKAGEILEEKKKTGPSGLNWDETTPKPGDNFNRASEMGEAD